MLLNLIRLILILLITFDVNAQGSLQNADFKTVEQLEAQGLTEGQAKAQMLHDTKVYVTTDGLNKLLSEAITDGDIGGGVAELTTDGDLLYYNSGLDRLGIGLEGQILQVSSLGFPEWADAPSVSPTTTEGDLIIRGETEDERLPIGDAGKILTSNGTTATWEDAPVSLPDQTSQSGKFLTTTVGTPSWSRIEDRLGGIKNNLLENGGFDAFGVASEYVITTDAIVDLTTSVSRTDEVSANNTRRLQIEASNGDGTPYDIKAVFTKSQDFGGKQMLAFCEVKTLRPDTFFIVGANGVEQSRREVIADGSWRYYEIPFVGGDTSQYIEINGETTASQEAINVDNCFMGKASPDYFARISGAQYVGGLTAQGITNCDWAVTSTTFTNFAADSDCNAFAANGIIKAPSTKIPAFVIPAGSPVGRYNINAHFNAQASSSAGFSCVYRLSSSSFDSKTYEVTSSVANGTGVGTQSFSVYVDNTDTDLTFQINAASGGGACRLIQTLPRIKYGFDVYYFPDSTNTIVTQNTELTAQSANEFVATVSDTGVVSGENFDWIDGNCTFLTNTYTCPVKSGVFDDAPVCVATVRSTNRVIVSGDATAKDSIVFITRTATTDTNISSAFRMKCTRSTDYRKHATIVGKFENINSSELCQVIARNNDNDVISNSTEDIPFKSAVKDNCNAWSNAGNTGSNTNDAFTAPKSAMYLVSGIVQTSAATSNGVSFAVNGAIIKRVSSTASANVVNFNGLIELNKNDVLTIISNGGFTLASSVTNHHISITELPDTESIIKNLSTQKTKCQTKILSANVTTDTTVTDLSFSNLNLGRKYSVYLQAKLLVSGDTSMGVTTVHNGDTIARIERGSGSGLDNSSTSSTGFFTASTTSLTFNTFSFGGTTPTLLGNGTLGFTWARLCELPDTYVETTEW